MPSIENIIQKGMSFEEKFFRNIYPEPNTGCWLWAGYSTMPRLGYGMMYSNKKSILAHRYSYEYHFGVKLIKSQLICHKCNIPACCNPDHLYIGTQKINMRQAYDQGRYKTAKPEKRVKQFTKDMIFVKEHQSICAAARELGIYQSSISSAIIGYKGMKSAAGYLWRLSDLDAVQERLDVVKVKEVKRVCN